MASQRTSTTTEVLVQLERGSGQTLHQQLEQQLREAIRVGRFAAGMTLPSSRAMATQLGVTRGVVVDAYEQLVAEGYLVTKPGGSTRVSDGVARPARSAPLAEPVAFRYDFRPGRPDLTEFPRQAWLRSARRALDTAPATRLGYLDGHGLPELRLVLSAYLDRVRGTSTNPADIVITSGFVQSLQLIARAAGRGDARRVAVEDPWHADYRRVLRSAGMEVVPVPVDEQGMQVARLDELDVGMAVLTPAHQYPTGAVLSAVRRSELLEWADRRDALVVEDDYDAEFRYDREPIGAVQGLDSDRVIYAGTTSKTLAPGLRLGWLAVPRRLSERIARAKIAADYGSGAIDQLALADFIGRGDLDRHLRHMRQVYRGRRDALLGGLSQHLPEVRPMGASAGLHVLGVLPGSGSVEGLVARAAEREVGLAGAKETWAGAAPDVGLVLGYGGIAEEHIDAGLRALADAWCDPDSPSGRASSTAPASLPAT